MSQQKPNTVLLLLLAAVLTASSPSLLVLSDPEALRSDEHQISSVPAIHYPQASDAAFSDKHRKMFWPPGTSKKCVVSMRHVFRKCLFPSDPHHFEPFYPFPNACCKALYMARKRCMKHELNGFKRPSFPFMSSSFCGRVFLPRSPPPPPPQGYGYGSQTPPPPPPPPPLYSSPSPPTYGSQYTPPPPPPPPIAGSGSYPPALTPATPGSRGIAPTLPPFASGVIPPVASPWSFGGIPPTLSPSTSGFEGVPPVVSPVAPGSKSSSPPTCTCTCTPAKGFEHAPPPPSYPYGTPIIHYPPIQRGGGVA